MSRLLRVAVAVLLSTAVTACGVRGADLGTTSSPCFKALPAAYDAVHDGGKLVGVRIERPGSRSLRRLPGHEQLGRTKICLVAFRGDFDRSTVAHPLATPLSVPTGPYAVVAVTEDGKRLLGTLVLRRLPLVFRHL
ncbi:MAG TPA: hypothetical protein VFA11_13450 [Acidimicrobiales bacterium]|nr:hypothetical protein [Acidimicrobiales bacterium]